jgi:hypothetical protein
VLHRPLAAVLATAAVVSAACAKAPDPRRYRLAHSGAHWDVVGDDRVVEDLRPRYPEFFAVILDPERHDEAGLRKVRDDLEHEPTDRRNFDALNAVAIAYFEINYRAEADRGAGLGYLARSIQSARLLAVPWRAYSVTADPRLRDAILDFFEDAGSGEKLASSATAPRLVRIVASLERKEDDPDRLARIHSIADAISARAEQHGHPPGAPNRLK